MGLFGEECLGVSLGRVTAQEWRLIWALDGCVVCKQGGGVERVELALVSALCVHHHPTTSRVAVMVGAPVVAAEGPHQGKRLGAYRVAFGAGWPG